MDENEFIEKNKPYWDKLAAFLSRKKRLNRLSADEITAFADAFRTAGHHLAYARTYYGDGATVQYLNSLVGAAHNRFFMRERFRLKEIAVYLTRGFPRAVGGERRMFALSTAVFLLSGIFVYLVCRADPSLARFFPSIEPNSGGALESWIFPALSSFIIVNNIRVAALAFAAGFLAGVGTLYILSVNGGYIGAYVYSAAINGSDMVYFWSMILPHGVLELTAVFISGAAGLTIGRGMLAPGDLSRKDSVVKAAKRAAYLLPGVAAMLLAAGLIEGFFTPLDIHYAWKLAFATFTFVLAAIYLHPVISSGKNGSLNNG